MIRKRLQAIIQISELAGLTGQRRNALFDRLREIGLTLERLPNLDRRELVSTLGLAPDQAEQFVSSANRAARLAERCDLDGMHVTIRSDAGWPGNLRRDDARIARPWLFILGDTSLLARRSIGIGGSRDASPRSIEITRSIVQHLVERDIMIVSGGARGIDTAAHSAALTAGGQTVVVLAQGIGTFQVPAQWRAPIRRGQLAVVSEYLPHDDWEAFRAIQRNGTIVQMGDSFIVPQAGATGGTLSAGQAALKMRWPLHVVRQTGPGAESYPGNQILMRQGGRPLDVHTQHPVTDDAVDAILTAQLPPMQQQTQLGLF